jgi:hypothetical protein
MKKRYSSQSEGEKIITYKNLMCLNYYLSPYLLYYYYYVAPLLLPKGGTPMFPSSFYKLKEGLTK